MLIGNKLFKEAMLLGTKRLILPKEETGRKDFNIESYVSHCGSTCCFLGDLIYTMPHVFSMDSHTGDLHAAVDGKYHEPYGRDFSEAVFGLHTNFYKLLFFGSYWAETIATKNTLALAKEYGMKPEFDNTRMKHNVSKTEMVDRLITFMQCNPIFSNAETNELVELFKKHLT